MTRMPPRPPLRSAAALLCTALLAAACGDPAGPAPRPADAPRRDLGAAAAVPDDARLVVTTGNNQSGTAGGVLLSPLGVRLLTAAGQPVPGVPITWEVTGGGGTLAVAVATTDAYGVSRATLELGPAPGPNTVRAAVATPAGVREAAFQLRGVAPPAVATVVAAGGNGQRFAPGLPLEQPLVVRALGPDGRGVPNAVVRWAAGQGGAFRSATAVTNVNGYAYGFWTLGPDAGPQAATATVAGLAPVAFAAEADPAARPVVATVSLGLGNTWLEPGETSSMYAAALSGRGLVVPGAVITWSVDRPDVLALRPGAGATSGTSRLEFTALAPGDAFVAVVADGVRRTILVRVFPPGGRPRGGDGCGGCG